MVKDSLVKGNSVLVKLSLMKGAVVKLLLVIGAMVRHSKMKGHRVVDKLSLMKGAVD